ncbi:LAME_0C04764g1_1 [Lachancea meyersii CBS 8951]|uniref:LAME_0C04764g1_1 n=1 Tax=Lachancea meyersii CBS 8951 TaxID=1266667 RepID=A0A1G4J140_9SACH|nr:LAME_0C04764g1_1 [Lachancea meyersii CBS 8951]
MSFSWARIIGVLSICLLALVAAQDYYAILGVGKDASDKDIKSAYRQLSKKYHPDKNAGDEDAHHKFIEVGEAYEVLSDEKKRQIYDQYGADALRNGGPGGPGGPGGAHGGFGGGFGDPMDIFEQMFGGAHRGGNRGRPRGHNLEAREDITLKQYYQGTTLDFTLNLNDFCEHCHGSGSQDGKTTTCTQCQGQGVIIQVVRMGPMTQKMQQICGACQGKGQVIKNKCRRCKGAKVERKAKAFHVDIPAGAPRDFVDVKQGEADKSPDFDAGDVFIKFSESSRNNMGYRRRGVHLYRTEVLTLEEALKGGWKREIEFFDANKKVQLARKAGVPVKHGEVERIPHFGMPLLDRANAFGDLFVDYVVVMPQTMSARHVRDEL